MAVSVLCLFLNVSWVGLQCMIMALPGHNHLLFGLQSGSLAFRGHTQLLQ